MIVASLSASSSLGLERKAFSAAARKRSYDSSTSEPSIPELRDPISPHEVEELISIKALRDAGSRAWPWKTF
ncbi:MAG: hypothetical protein O7H41_08645, partial [Planctomycetota bacterium]|nr:hypothetical protein [Planctomycetota bacterium]